MSGLRGRSAVAADHRSALPQIPGLPWWAAAIVAGTAAAIGAAYDAGSGNQALGGVFAACYVLGCVAAVVAVRQSGVFTAVIQPPLILFVAVPAAYFSFHASTIVGIKDLLINCGYPLIERFPLMFFTSATVLLIGMIRWYLGAAARRAVPKDPDVTPVEEPGTETPAATRTSSRRSRRSTTERPARAATSAATAASAAAADVEDEAPRAPRRTARTAAPAAQRSPGAAAGTGSRRSRHARPPETDLVDPGTSRPRRRTGPPVDPPAEPRKRARSGEPRDRRETRDPGEPRDRRPLPPLDRRTGYERPERSDRPDRPSRRERPDLFDRPERSERPDRPQRSERPQRRPRVSSDYEPYEPPPASRPNGGGGTHHPVSRVRYRDTDDGESRTENRSRPRPSRHSAPDSWEYDI